MTTSHSFDSLPSKVLTFTGHDFYQLIKGTLGEPEANLLNKISVNPLPPKSVLAVSANK